MGNHGQLTLQTRRLRIAFIAAGVILAALGGGLVLRQKVIYPPRWSMSSRAWFENVAGRCGIDFQHVSGHAQTFYLPEIMTGGVGLIDYDRDGNLDVYFVQGGRVVDRPATVPTNNLYRNLGGGTFADVTDEAGVGDTGYGMACTCGDFNNDGWPDLYVTNCGPNVLYRNNGDGTFTDVTETTGVGHPTYSGAAAFVDYDNDGDLDLFVANYVAWSAESELVCNTPTDQPEYCGPLNYKAPAPDKLYRNEGNGTFTEVSEISGISSRAGTGVGVVCGDFDQNGLVDLCVAKDCMATQLWLNQGDGTFRDEALIRGVAYSGQGAAEASMGIDAQDIDDDGDLDLIMGHYTAQTTTLYINHGDFFEDETLRFGLAATLPFTSFALALVDLNNDGMLDTYSANGRVLAGPVQSPTDDPYAEANQLFEGLADGTFREVMPRGGLADELVHTSRAGAFGDYDNDGDVDIIILNKDGPTYVLRNLTDGRNHWIAFRVTNRYGSTALNARVQIDVAGKTRFRNVSVSYSYFASNDPRVYFGLGKTSRVANVSVTWPDGTVQTYGDFRADQIVEIRK